MVRRDVHRQRRWRSFNGLRPGNLLRGLASPWTELVLKHMLFSRWLDALGVDLDAVST